MTLPDISRLSALSTVTLRNFGKRLADIGLTTRAAQPVVAAVEALPPQLRRPARAWHLRRIQEKAGTAMRMLMFQDPVTEAEARAAMGDLFDFLLRGGLLERGEDGSIVSPYVLAVVDDLYILSDDLARGGEAVMGLGETTIALCLASLPDRVIERALDLGCGSGTCALVLAHRSKRVVATDINPRAIALAKINAAINGIGNVDFRLGSLFDPVAGEAFDLIVSQPPFVPRPEGAEGATFLYGGARGDEIALRLCAEIGPRLAAGGRAVLLVEWPAYGEEPLEARVRSAVGGDPIDILLLRMPDTSLDEHATHYGAGIHPRLDEAFERDVIARRGHLDRLGIRALNLTFTILQRTEGGAGWTELVPVEPLHKIRVTSGRIDKMMAARAILGKRERLLAATLRVPAGTVLSEEQDRPGGDVESTIWARFAPDALVQRTGLTALMLGLLTILHESPTARAGIERFAEAYETTVEAAIEKVAPVIEDALRHGLLEVCSFDAPPA